MNDRYPFVNEPLPYAYDAMEPFIDETTMRLHHDKHLQTYIDNLNQALSKYPHFQSWSLAQLIVNTSSLPEDIRMVVHNNGGGVFNHRLYFSNLMNPAPQQPTGALAETLQIEYGSYQAFRNQMKAAALSIFGSGYAWLIVNAAGQLRIITTANQDTPLTMGLCPLLNLDVWEHAYYLKYHNLRTDYIDNWFRIINWNHADDAYRQCLRMLLP